MRQRVEQKGAGGLADYEILEMLLFPGVPRRDTKPQAKALINSFGSLSAVLEAPAAALKEAGMGPACVRLLTLMPEIAEKLSTPQTTKRADIGKWDKLLTYCHTAFTGLPAGQLRVLFLDIKNHLLADEPVIEMSDKTVEACVADILKQALAHNASALVTVRLVSDGLSRAQQMQKDIPFVQALLKAAPLLALDVYDHLVMRNGQWLSFRNMGQDEW